MQDRFGNPFWLSALFAWCLLNWPLLITAIFQTEHFGVRYIINYTSSNSTARYIWWPLVFGLIYSVFSGVLKETLEGAAKSSRSLVAQKFQDWGFYPSISIEDHQKEISNLERRIIKNEFRKADFDNLKSDYESLESANDQMKERIIKIETVLINHLTSSDENGNRQKIKLLEQLQTLEICTEVAQTDVQENKNNSNHKTMTGGVSSTVVSEILKKTAPRKDTPSNTTKIDRKNALSEAIKSHEKTEINDPKNLKTLLLTLLLFKSPQIYSTSPNPNDIGLEKEVFHKSLQSAFKAQLLQRNGNGNGFGLTSEGIKFIKNEIAKDANSNISLILNEAEKVTVSQIIRTLKEKHLSPTELSKQVQYHPDFSRILMDLKRQEIIQDRGNILFLKE